MKKLCHVFDIYQMMISSNLLHLNMKSEEMKNLVFMFFRYVTGKNFFPKDLRIVFRFNTDDRQAFPAGKIENNFFLTRNWILNSRDSQSFFTFLPYIHFPSLSLGFNCSSLLYLISLAKFLYILLKGFIRWIGILSSTVSLIVLNSKLQLAVSLFEKRSLVSSPNKLS